MARRKGDHSSRIHPPVPNRPGVSNWVQEAGGLPSYIRRVARHIIADSGYTVSRAIAAAVSQTKKRAAQGNAQAMAAVAQWEKMKASRVATSTSVAGATIDLATVSYSTGPSKPERAKAQSKGQAFKSGRFPIRNLSDAKKAIHAFGRAKPEDKPALKRFIIRRLRALGAAHLIPKNWTAKELAAAYDGLGVIELAGKRGPYERHKLHTEQFGKKKGNLKAKADWRHPYRPLSQTAFALKAKHVSKDDLDSSGRPKPGKSREFNLPKPPHLTTSKTDQSRSAKERSREPEDVTAAEAKRNKPEKSEPAGPSVASLKKERASLEKKVAAGNATAAEKKRLNTIVAQLKKRASKPAASSA